MALAKRENQLSVSAIPKQSARESDRKRNVKVLDEETYVQVRAADNTLNLANITKIFSQIFRYLVRGNIKPQQTLSQERMVGFLILRLYYFQGNVSSTLK